jgi:hypothetical protein
MKPGLPFDKQRWFIALAAVVSVVGGLLGIVAGIKPYFAPAPAPSAAQNTEIVFDRSAGMTQRLADGTTKLDLARRAVEKVLGHEIVGDSLALRALGGACPDGLTHPPPTLAFRQESAVRVREAIKELEPKGDATLVASIRDAIVDFSDAARFAEHGKRIIVITGNLDGCGDDIARDVVPLLDRLGKDSQGRPKIVLDLDFIGIGMDSAAKLQLDHYAEQTGGAAHFADDLQQLDNVIEIIEVARVMRAGNAVSGVLNASAELLSPAITALKKKDYAAAERGLQNARGEFARSEVPFQDLVKRQKSGIDAQWEGQYRLIYQAADKSRALQSQVISLTETMLSQAKSSDEPALKASIDKYEEIRAAYNQSDDDLQALLKELAAMVRSH